ncbi:hypothetical protein [Novosphingobium guangzhouense]|uniref:Uncharacterized protein n=1 Tax=Novosphingobium guangzhouense TaxID=1850347 RepID=A0A2K2G0P6_9SPHN|nr:hypothetical protein [Novosphingobium guangzhouense]PNU04613.1 hypothetical protein A8V01_19585 [Novosphingobium guangzhouense]
MSKITLDDLLERFNEAKVRACMEIIRSARTGKSLTAYSLATELLDMEPDDMVAYSEYRLVTMQMRNAAELYVVARDQGMAAATIWKLRQP